MKARPNLLLISTDQQRFDTIHAAGNPHIFTPHLNWLMDTGVRFSRAYTDAPICVPARATMITGQPFYKMPEGFGNWGQPTAPDPCRTLPGLLTAAGYQTKSVGKVHYTPPRCTYGFEHTEILEDYYRDRRSKGGPLPMDHGVGQNEMEPVISTVSDADSLTHWTVDRAIDFLETRDTTRPFFLNVGFSKPHPPFDPAMNYWALYQNQKMPEPWTGDWSRNLEDIPQGFLGSTFSLNGADRFSPEQWAHIRRAYYACITQIDYNLGLLFARLRELELLDNTLLVFTSDHGEMLGDHHMGAKTIFLEGSSHIPMIIRAPAKIDAFKDIKSSSTCDTLVSLADLMPTFLAAAGVPRPPEIPESSKDLLEICRQKTDLDRCFIGAYSDQCGIIRDRWKYVFTSTGGGELLFDLQEDPNETRNLTKLQPEIRDQLHRALAEELSSQRHPAAEGGRLKTLQEASTSRSARWPGFHSRDHTPSDVLH